MDKSVLEELCTAALKVRERAYAPYSQFAVGAALLGRSGQIYSGCNVENASFGATICAERAAAAAAVAAGETTFQALVVATAVSPPVAPCGICRQFLGEFGLDLPIFLINPQGERNKTQLRDLLPAGFKLKNFRDHD